MEMTQTSTNRKQMPYRDLCRAPTGVRFGVESDLTGLNVDWRTVRAKALRRASAADRRRKAGRSF